MSQPFPPRVLTLPTVWEENSEPYAVERPVEGTSATSDEELLTRLKAQDREALGILFDRYSRLVLAIGFRVLRDRGEAQDLLQTVFLYLFQKADRFNAERGSAKTWIIQIAYHRALDKRTYLAHRQFYLGTDLNVAPDTLSADEDVERETDLRLSGEHLFAAIGDLPEKQRVTLELFFFEGMDWQEIGDRLGDSVANVRHHYYRGLEKLRKNPSVRRLRGGKQ